MKENRQRKQLPCDSVYVTFQSRQNCRDRNHISICQELVLGKEIGYKRAFRKLEIDENILYVDFVGGYIIINIY